MPSYNLTGFQWAGWATYNSDMPVTINDDDSELDWFGGDPGTAQTATIGGNTYTVTGGGLLEMQYVDNDGGGASVTEDFLFFFATGYGWVFVPMPGSSFTEGDRAFAWGPNLWADTNGVPYSDTVCFTRGTIIATATGPKNIASVTTCLAQICGFHLNIVCWFSHKKLS